MYAGPTVAGAAPLRAIRPDGSLVELPPVQLRAQPEQGERYRFLPNGEGLVYMQGFNPWQDFWLLELASKKSRQLALLTNPRLALSFLNT